MSDVYRGRDVAPDADWWLAGDGKWYHPGLSPERQASTTVPPADGWWLGVDGAWYPAELHPEAAGETPLSDPGTPESEHESATASGFAEVRSEDDLFAAMTEPSVAVDNLPKYPTPDLVGVGAGSDELVDTLPFVDLDDAPAVPAFDGADVVVANPPQMLAPESIRTPVDGPPEPDNGGLDPLKNPSPALSMPVPPIPSSVRVADDQPLPASTGSTLPQRPMPGTPDPVDAVALAANPFGNERPALSSGTLSPSLTTADIAGPIFPAPTAAPAGPVSSGERMVLPSPGQVIDHAAVPAAGAPLHLPAPTIGDARHDLPAPVEPSAALSAPMLSASEAEMSPPPPVFSPADVVPTAPEFAGDAGMDMDEFAASDSDHSMERLDESRSKRKLAVGVGCAALLAFVGLFLFNQFRGGGTEAATAPTGAVAVADGDAPAVVDPVVGSGDADATQELAKLRTTGIEGTDAEITTFAKGVCAEVDSGSSWAQVLSYAASSELAITDPGMVAKVIASSCPAANGG